MAKWTNVPGTLIVTGVYSENGEIDVDHGPEWGVLLHHALIDVFGTVQDGDEAELQIEFTSSGSSSPGCWYMPNGDPGDPPYYDDERIIKTVKATLYRDGQDIKAGTITNDTVFRDMEEVFNGPLYEVDMADEQEDSQQPPD